MNTTTIDITGNEPINITPMTPLEAMECDAALHQHLDSADKHLDSAGALLLDMKRREGWKALNFGTWTEYLESRAVGGKSRRRALELLQAQEVKENLAMCGIPHMDIPAVTSQLTTLAKLPPEQQPEALHKASEIAQAQGKKRNAAHIAQAVKEIKPSKKQALAQPPKTDPLCTIKPKNGWDISPQQLSSMVKEHKIAIHFEHRGDEYFFEFRGLAGSISESGFHSESISDRSFASREYLNPGVWADFRAEELYYDYQKSLFDATTTSTQASEQPHGDVDADFGSTTNYIQDHELYLKAGLSKVGSAADMDALINSNGVRQIKLVQATTQVLSAAVETCLGEFSMPASLDEPLSGTVYISPDKAIGAWVKKLLKAYKSREVTEAIALLPLNHQAFTKFADYALCPLPESLVLVYLGKRVDSFVMCFEDLGTVWHRYGWRP